VAVILILLVGRRGRSRQNAAVCKAMQNSVVQQVAHEFLSARKRQSYTHGEFLQAAHCAIAKLSLLITGPSHTSLRKVTV
jgi:hypothetical protein